MLAGFVECIRSTEGTLPMPAKSDDDLAQPP